jgi:hypothetical protein
MSTSHPTGCAGGAQRGVAELLGLAAAPTFATLALLSGGEAACGSAHQAGVMYGLMAAFHLSPWLRLLGRGNAE